MRCNDPVLLMKVAGAAGVDPRWSVATACDGAAAVLGYVGEDEPRPRMAVEMTRSWLERAIPAERCSKAADDAEVAAQAYRSARKQVPRAQRRAYRAAAYAAFAASHAAAAARDAALTTELEYDENYTFEDAWDGARVSCAELAADALRDAVEAAISATAARITQETGSQMAGTAAAQEARPGTEKWASDIVRSRIPAEAVLRSAASLLGEPR